MLLLLSCTRGSVDLPDETEPIDSSVPEDTGCESTTWYMDTDGDGHGDENNPVESCEPVVGAVIVGGDCDDGDFEIGPDIEEECGDGFDNDCDGEIDEAAEGCEPVPTFERRELDDEKVFSITSDDQDMQIGAFVKVGDQDADGVHDVLLSYTGIAEGANLFSGAGLAGDYVMSEAAHVFTYGGAFGSAVLVPDIDGDGQMEVVGVNGSDQGTMTLHASSSFGEEPEDLWRVTSTGDSSSFGQYDFDAEGDFDGDGKMDLSIGAPYDSEAGWLYGAVYVFFDWETNAPSRTRILGTESSTLLGMFNGAGDLDGDGYDELVVSQVQNSGNGRMCFHEGTALARRDSTLEIAACPRIMGDDDHYLRKGFAMLGDLDGDDAQEIAVNHNGRVGIFSGADVMGGYASYTFPSQALATIESREPGEGGPWTMDLVTTPLVALSGATGPDSQNLVLAGTWSEDSDGWETGIFLFDAQAVLDAGMARPADAEIAWMGDHPTNTSDVELRNFGDVDGDGDDDLLVGDPAADDGQGAVYLLSP